MYIVYKTICDFIITLSKYNLTTLCFDETKFNQHPTIFDDDVVFYHQ